MPERIPASRTARLISGVLLAELVAAFALGSYSPSHVAEPSDQAAALARIRAYILVSSAIRAALSATLASSFLLLGGAALWSGSFPAYRHGLPWNTRRLNGFGARVVGSLLLFIEILTLPWLWNQLRAIRIALSL